ncbi:MAG: BrnT family toxin [Gammaproteobacteria bacterium]
MSGADELRFCWDDDKAAANFDKHGVSFESATYALDDPMRLDQEDVFAQGERRNIVFGEVDGIVLTVVYAWPEEDFCRIISARVATAHERKVYGKNIF